MRILDNDEPRIRITDTEIIPVKKDNKLNLTHKINCIISGPNDSPFQFGLFKFQIYMTYIDVDGCIDDDKLKNEEKKIAAKIVFGSQDFIYHPVFKNRVNITAGENKGVRQIARMRSELAYKNFEICSLDSKDQLSNYKVSLCEDLLFILGKDCEQNPVYRYPAYSKFQLGQRNKDQDKIGSEYRILDHSLLEIIIESVIMYLKNPDWFTSK